MEGEEEEFEMPPLVEVVAGEEEERPLEHSISAGVEDDVPEQSSDGFDASVGVGVGIDAGAGVLHKSTETLEMLDDSSDFAGEMPGVVPVLGKPSVGHGLSSEKVVALGCVRPGPIDRGLDDLSPNGRPEFLVDELTKKGLRVEFSKSEAGEEEGNAAVEK